MEVAWEFFRCCRCRGPPKCVLSKLQKLNNAFSNSRELVNYRHPDPRRAWKGGSGRQFTTSLPADPADALDLLDPLACAKLVFRVRETLLLTPEADFVCV